MADSREILTTGLFTQRPFTVVAITFAIYCFSLGIYRLFFHPLAKFPGPKLGGLTYWYEIYYDVYRRGEYTKVIGDLHQKYGPIIRINPDELHVNDPNFIDTLYPSSASGKRREISPWFFRPFGFEDSHFGTANHELHRMRRAPINRFFSKAMVTKLEPVIREKAIKYCNNLKSWAGTGAPLNVAESVACFSADVITEYCFGRSYNFLDDPKMQKSLYQPIHVGSEATITFKHFPFYMKAFLAIPASIMRRLSPDAELWRVFRLDVRSQVREIKDSVRAKEPRSHTTIFHDILDSGIPESEKNTERLAREAQALLGAGMETVSWSLSVNLYHLLASPLTLSTLRAELTSHPTATTWAALEQLPYLNACIHEGLRLSYGIPSRLARIAPDEAMLYTDPDGKTWAVPPGYAVGMSAWLAHHDEGVFPDSWRYVPERWLGEGRGAERGLLSFSRGSRGCLGMNLAYAELFIFLATLVRGFGDRLELFETTGEDVAFDHDAFVPAVKAESKGVRVLVN